MDNDFSSFVTLSEDMASAMRLLQLEDIQEIIEEPSVDEARQVVRWLDNLPSAEMPLGDWLDADAPEAAFAKAGNLSQLVKIFIRKLKRARKKRPNILSADAMIENAAQAAAAMTHAVIEFTLSTLPGQHPKTPELEASLRALPPQAAMRQSQSVKRLTEIVATGMERASGKNVSGKSAPERLVEISTRMQATTRTLRSIDSLQPPAREESIELAREILRRLKNMQFSDKPIKVLIDAGNSEDKMAMAQQLDEAAEMYKNLVQEAAEIQSSILQDQSVRNATDAVKTFAHGVKLMAAKEMPNSIASAQQISADDAHDPQAWDKLQGHTVERLVKSMEGGLEKAANNIENDQEQQQQEDQQQQQQEMLDAALHSDSTKRKKKRKRRSQRSGSGGKGGKKQLKEKMALEADDYVLKQGRFSKDAQSARDSSPAVSSLTAEALSAVKQLGDTLFKIGNQAKDAQAALATVSSTDKIMPDDKSITQRVIEEELRKGPRNQGGPGAGSM